MKHFRRGSLISCLVACSVLAATSSISGGVVEIKSASTTKHKLPEAVEKGLAELVAEAARLKHELRMEEMKKIITEISEAVKLSDEQKKKLEGEVKPAVQRSLEPWKAEFDNKLRPYLSNEGEGATGMLASWRAEQLVPSGFPGEFGKPEEDAGWKEALKQTLTKEQHEELGKIAARREQKFNEQIAEYLKPALETTRKARAAQLAGEVEDLKTLLKLPHDRVKQLEKMAETSTERACELVRRRTTKYLAAMNEQQRSQIMAHRRSSFNLQGADADEAGTDESSEGLWMKGVTSLLTEEERKRWESAAEERSGRSVRALALLFIAEMDQHVLFTSGQRENLEPIAARKLAEWSKKKPPNEFVSPTLAKLFDAREIKSVLDDGQWERWEAAARGELHGRRGIRMLRGARVLTLEPKKEEEAPQKVTLELPDDETLYTMYFEKNVLEMRRQMSDEMNAVLGDVRRIVKLPPEGLSYLELAAKGTVEHSLDMRRSQMESWTRGMVQGAKGESLRKRLADLSTEGMGFGDEGTNAEHVLWKDALAEVLTTEDKKAWSAATAARAAYREQAFAWGVLAELNQRYHLSNDQFTKLQPLVETAVADYYDDFMNMFGRSSSNIIPRYMITLFLAVPEDASRSILNDRQWKQWKEVDSKPVTSWWESMKSNHKRKSTVK